MGKKKAVEVFNNLQSYKQDENMKYWEMKLILDAFMENDEESKEQSLHKELEKVVKKQITAHDTLDNFNFYDWCAGVEFMRKHYLEKLDKAVMQQAKFILKGEPVDFVLIKEAVFGSGESK